MPAERRPADPGPSTGPVVLSEIGRGAHAVVHRVRFRGAEYAMKVLQAADGDEERMRAFRREGALLASIDHPGVARVHELGDRDGRPYLLMDLIEGEPLTHLLAGGRLPAQRAVRVAHEIASALAAAHAAGLVHRDVTPHNIIVGRDGAARLVDFGLATRVGAADADLIAGTPAYCSPEQAGMLRRQVDGRSDLYSLGAVLYECVTGSLPFVAADPGALLRLHATAPVPDPRRSVAGLGGALSAIIVRLLAKDPDDRYQSAVGLLDDLQHVAEQPDRAEFPLDLGDQVTRGQHGPRLVGRDGDVATLMGRWARASRGQGGVVLVRGAPGAGKSRLVRELTVAAQQAGGLVLHGKSAPDDPQPLAALRAAVDGYVRAVLAGPAESRPAEVERLRAVVGPGAPLVKNLSPALAELLAVPDAVGEVGQEQYTAAVAALLVDLARSAGKAVLYLDDAQWFDEATRRALEQLSARLTDAPLLVVVTARDDPPSVAAVDELRARLGKALDTEIELRPLDAEAVARLVAAVSGGMSVDPEDARRLATRSGGNPFTLLQYLRAILDAGLARPSWGMWHVDVDHLDALQLPEDAAGLVLQRVDALDAEARRLLGAAAVVGSQFDPQLVAEVAGTDQVRAVLTEAVWHSLVEPRALGRYAFVHDRIREALLHQFDETTLRSLHDQVADAIEAAGDADAETAYALARHTADGDPAYRPDRRFEAAYAAGRRALADHAPATALTFLERAAAAAEAASVTPDCAFHQTLARAYHAAGRFAEAEKALDEALACAPTAVERARTLLLLAGVEDSAWNSVQPLATVERGLTELGKPSPRNPVALILLTVVMFVGGCLIRLTGLGYGKARGELRDRLALRAALHNYASAACMRELRPFDGVTYILRSYYLANRLGRCPESARAFSSLAILARVLGRQRFAARLSGTAAKMADRLGDPVLSATVTWMDDFSRHGAGIDGGRSMSDVLDRQQRWLDEGLALDGYAVLRWDWLLRGDMAEAEAGFARSKARAEAAGQSGRSGVVATDACLYALRGRNGEAAAELRRLERADAPLHQRVDTLIARLQNAVEQRDLGDTFDDTVAAYDALGVRLIDVVPSQHGFQVYQAYGRIAQLRQATTDTDRQARLTQARQAVAVLGRVTLRPLLAAHHQVARAALCLLEPEPRGRRRPAGPAAALALLAAAEPILGTVDAPLVAFEAALVRARAHTALGADGESGRQAEYALRLADAQGWPHRTRAVAAEFPRAAGTATTHQTAQRVGGDSRASARWKALEEISLAASRVLDPTRLGRIALDETIRILGAERAFLLLHEAETDTLTPHVGRDAAGNDLVELTNYSASLVDKVARDGRAVVVTGTEEGAALGAQSVVAYGLRSVLAAPLQLDGRLLGVVYLDSRVAKGVFTDEDVDILTAITHHVAVALDTARAAQLEVAVEAANRRRDLAETLRHAMSHLADSLDPDVVLRRLMTTATESLGADRAWLLTGQPIDATVAALAGPDASWEVRDTTFALTAPLSLTEPTTGPGAAPWPADLGAEPSSWLALPLASGDERHGVLLLTGCAASGGYGEDDVQLGATLVGQAMTAFDKARLFTQMHHLATVDGLTGLANRRHLFEAAGREIALTRRRGTALAAVMVDIDHFKRINDTYGHQVGDEVIRAVAARMRLGLRESDIAGRYGGEEFVLLLPDCGDGAEPAAERLRAEIADAPIPTAAGPIDVTISVGVAHLRTGDADADALLARADASLYRAKQTGRNRVVADDRPYPVA
ncbi:diguanylate cyclase [Actinoplanes sp. NPDC051859]|uniref:diguanylate cyclase n=1 Tax=Actinoplanes sp. NPDC051859 TaxID=3363909 RepID=UPI0037BCFDCA